MAGRDPGDDDLARWLGDGYATAYRTAYGLLRNRADAEDAVQEAFLRAWRFRAAVPGGESVSPWLYRVVVNACLSKLKRDGRYRATVLSASHGEGPTGEEDSRVASLSAGPEATALDHDLRDVVLGAMADLPEHLRVVVVLRYYAGLSESEIAAVIHRRPGTVKSRLHAARARLGADGRLGALAASETDRADGAARSPGGERPCSTTTP